MTKRIKVAIFDIDGCLADDRPRRHLLPVDIVGATADGDVAHEEFDAYHRHSHGDSPLNLDAFREVVRQLDEEKCETKILFFTSRPEKYRNKTSLWLDKILGVDWNLDRFSCGLYMRMANDINPSPVVKYNMLVGAISRLHVEGYDVEIIGAHDDRTDVLDCYARMGVRSILLNEDGAKSYGGVVEGGIFYTPFPPQKVDALLVDKSAAALTQDGSNKPLSEHNTEPSIDSRAPLGSSELAEIAGIFDTMAETLRSRAADYGYNAEKVALVMNILFPKGVSLNSASDYEAWHLFELIIVKLTRFVNSGLVHKDSIHDMAIYAGFVERLVTKHNIQINK